jgi:hypothetical protein
VQYTLSTVKNMTTPCLYYTVHPIQGTSSRSTAFLYCILYLEYRTINCLFSTVYYLEYSRSTCVPRAVHIIQSKWSLPACTVYGTLINVQAYHLYTLPRVPAHYLSNILARVHAFNLSAHSEWRVDLGRRVGKY